MSPTIWKNYYINKEFTGSREGRSNGLNLEMSALSSFMPMLQSDTQELHTFTGE
jgi:hypothetical protein